MPTGARAPRSPRPLRYLGKMPSTPDRSFGFATRALHAGQRPDAETGARHYRAGIRWRADPRHLATGSGPEGPIERDAS